MSVPHRPAARPGGFRGFLLAGAALIATTALGGAAFAAAAPAAAADDTAVGELVVTAPHYVPTRNMAATKTSTPLIETPQSISVIPRDQIDILDFESTQEAVRYTAGVVGENFGPDQRYDYVTVRGFYPVEYIDGLQAPIAPGSSLNDIGVDLWGFDSIEIIKGPARPHQPAAGGCVPRRGARPVRDL
jgi:iron complex outermembrane receptor protein